jgi:hypothetical protein
MLFLDPLFGAIGYDVEITRLAVMIYGVEISDTLDSYRWAGAYAVELAALIYSAELASK